MFLWYESWAEIKELLVTKIRDGATFDEALHDIITNNSELYNIFFNNVNKDADSFLKFEFHISTRR